jgi:PH-interacting protein
MVLILYYFRIYCIQFNIFAICITPRYPHIEKDHLVKLLKQLITSATPPLHGKVGRNPPNAADVPTLLGSGPFSLLDCM